MDCSGWHKHNVLSGLVFLGLLHSLTLASFATCPDEIVYSDSGKTNDNIQLASALSAATRNPLTLWQCILHANAELEASPDSTQSFAFEFALLGPSQNDPEVLELRRWICDGDKQRALALAIGSSTVPRSCFIDDRLWILQPDPGAWQFAPKKRWAFVADDRELTNFTSSDPAFWPDGSDGFLRLDLPGWLGRFVGRTGLHGRWDEKSGTLHVVNSKGVEAWVAVRTPDDAQRLGSPLRSVAVKAINGARLVFCSINLAKNVPIRVDWKKVDRLADSVPSREVFRPPGFPLDAARPADVKNAVALWNGLWPDFASNDPAGHPATMLAGLTVSGRQTEFRDLKNAENKSLNAFVTLVSSAIWSLENSAIWKPAQINRIVLDDPYIKWRLLERHLSLIPAGELAGNFLVDLARADFVPLDLRCQYAAAVAELGCPPFVNWLEAESEEFADRDLMEAILWSRWQLPCEDRHVRACQSRLMTADASSSMSRLLIETLARMHRLGEIPPERFSEWSEQAIVKAPDAASRWKQLVLLSSFRSGQEYLQRLSERTHSEDVRKEISRVLKTRAAAAVATGRHEEMTLEICRKLLKNN